MVARMSQCGWRPLNRWLRMCSRMAAKLTNSSEESSMGSAVYFSKSVFTENLDPEERGWECQSVKSTVQGLKLPSKTKTFTGLLWANRKLLGSSHFQFTGQSAVMTLLWCKQTCDVTDEENSSHLKDGRFISVYCNWGLKRALNIRRHYFIYNDAVNISGGKVCPDDN